MLIKKNIEKVAYIRTPPRLEAIAVNGHEHQEEFACGPRMKKNDLM
jgi:hypothetical protein